MHYKKLLIGVGIFAAVVVGIIAYRDLRTAPNLAPATNIFQPIAEMLSVASGTPGVVIPGKEVTATNTKPLTIEGTKAVLANVPAYTYRADACKNTTTTPYNCMSSLYSALVHNYGVDTAFYDIKKRFNDDSRTVAICHPIMHVIGRAAATLYPKVSEAYRHGDSFCWSGYYHGILEGVVAQIGVANLPSNINTICADIPGKSKYDFEYYNCVHGLGHGIMELWGDDVFKSLAMCDNLLGSWEQQSCYSGVFMENIIINTDIGAGSIPSLFLKPSEPLYPCTAVENRYKEQCYLGQTSYALQVNHYQFQPVVDLCATVEQPFRAICFQSVGRDVANQALHDAARTKSLCALATDASDQTNCIIGAVKEFISYYHDIEQAKAFCSILESDYQQTCFSTGASYFTLF